jgi:two-component sensor histidine kinase
MKQWALSLDNPSQHSADEHCGLRSSAVVNGALCLVLNNTLAAIEDGRRRMLDFPPIQALAPPVRHRLEVIFEELVSNTIRHGFTQHSSQSIHVRVDPRPASIEFTFEDDGAPFNPLEMPAPESFSTIENARIGGLGISLLVRLSASLRYERLTSPHCDGFTPNNRIVVSIATGDG